MLYLYGNYGGDVMNFDLAAELADAEGIQTSTVLGADDVASAPAGSESRRRGVAGITFLYKVAGAKASKGRRWRRWWRSSSGRRPACGPWASPCRHAWCPPPENRRSTCQGEMEMVLGIHGEPGVRRGPLEPAAQIADQLVDRITADLPFKRGDEQPCW